MFSGLISVQVLVILFCAFAIYISLNIFLALYVLFLSCSFSNFSISS